ncbi:hypothetical protein BU23DRAFT_552091 [Bimuria novae-zelandiae CBS 107.79]|uniref:Uncharacterized protein n=1 Tax=Bimuria novae-zelandiae CBS 107.79 TaxID=1447943 RepID=A0A6A5VS59_9PLEO|nr:hypothetical protein BU23DRAFT_552091 [Bimuria novae-zelandiae CBS 107.79]
MATESDPTITRVTQHDLWQYYNPDVAIADLPLLTEPVEPMAHQYKVNKAPGTIHTNANLNNTKF